MENTVLLGSLVRVMNYTTSGFEEDADTIPAVFLIANHASRQYQRWKQGSLPYLKHRW